jgi:thymidylate kinase
LELSWHCLTPALANLTEDKPPGSRPMQARGHKPSPTIVSFSGIDGAGKTTQIEALRQRLQNMGMKVKLIRFWDDVSKLRWVRESAGHTLFRGDKGVGTPQAPITRRDKNVRSWPMTCVRLALYFFDAVSARSAVKSALRSNADFIVFDRYCYDELANLNLQSSFLRAYANLLLKIVIRLDKSYLLDADPLQACTRKPEYPLDFVYRNRAAYLEMQQLTGRMTVILPMSVAEVEREIWRHTSEDLCLPSSAGNNLGDSVGKHYVESRTVDEPFTRPAA